ncbi:hypothetical protein VCHE48_3999, partial [Vibrio cholerae HE48]
MVTVVVFEFSVMRCQPLRRALTGKMEMPKASEQKEFANVSLWAMTVISKELKIISRIFAVLGNNLRLQRVKL